MFIYLYFSYFWGWLTDKIGRRPVILISLALTIIGMASFGLSVSLTMAIITRLFVGLTNGMSVKSNMNMINAFNLNALINKYSVILLLNYEVSKCNL